MTTKYHQSYESSRISPQRSEHRHSNPHSCELLPPSSLDPPITAHYPSLSLRKGGRFLSDTEDSFLVSAERLRLALISDRRSADNRAQHMRGLINRSLALGAGHVFECSLWVGDDARLYRVWQMSAGGAWVAMRLMPRSPHAGGPLEPYTKDAVNIGSVELSDATKEPTHVVLNDGAAGTRIALVRSAQLEIAADWTWTMDPWGTSLQPDFQYPHLNEAQTREEEGLQRDYGGICNFLLERWPQVIALLEEMATRQGATRIRTHDGTMDVVYLCAKLTPGYAALLKRHSPNNWCPNFTSLVAEYLNRNALGPEPRAP